MNNVKTVEWLLRIGVAGEFIGHGILGIQGKEQWVGWIREIMNVDAPTAVTLLLIVGIVDVLVGLAVLVKPLKLSILLPILLWATAWAFWSALVRPIVGIGWLDFIERAANWAAPLALYFLIKKNSR